MEKKENSFDNTWNKIQQLSNGTEIKNWTYHSGFLPKGDFTIVSKDKETIVIDTPDAKNLQNVPKKDFQKVFEIWDDYVNGNYPRSKIRDNLSYYSKYIISIFHSVLIKEC